MPSMITRKLGDEWYVLSRHPSGQREHVRRFKTETEAKNWIARKSKAWLKKRSYGDALVAASSPATQPRIAELKQRP